MIKNILVAGGSGYIGFHLSSTLEEQSSFTSIDFDDRPSEKDCINLDFTNTKLVNNFAENCEHQE